MKITRLIIPVILIVSSFISAETIARVVKASGTVRLKQVTASEFNVVAKPGMRIGNGDVIRVEPASFAVVLYLDDKSIIKIKENSQFQFVDSENTRTIDLEIGTLINEVKKENRTKTFRIQTPTSVASVKGTTFGVIVDASGIDQFYGQEGLFDVFNLVSGQTVAVGPGQKALSSPTGNVISAPAAPTEFPVDPDPNAGTGELEQLIEQYSPKPGETLPDELLQEILPEDTPIPEPETGPATPDADVPQSAPSTPSKSFGMGFGVGSVTIDGIVYNQLAFRPELKFGKLGLGFDLVIYLDNEGNIRQEEWDEPTDLADKFLYIRWAEKGDPLWFKLGALENVVLGYGGLLSGYSNMMEFPTVRQIGVNGGFSIGSFGLELFMSNLKDFSRGGTLLGLRGSYTISKQFPLSFGANLVMDLNQFSGLVDSDDDTYPDAYDDFPNDKQFWNDTDGDGNPDPHVGTDSTLWDTDSDDDQIFDPWIGGSDQDVVLKGEPFSIQGNKAAAIGYSFDVGYPILKSKMAQLTLFTEYNYLSFPAGGDSGTVFFRPEDRNGYGITIPGLRASFFKFINISLEYRLKNGYFVPQFFDQSYDITRVVPVQMGDSTFVKTKDMIIFADEESNLSLSGLYGAAGIDVFGFVNLNASYSSMVKDSIKFNSFYAGLEIKPNLIPKLSEARAYYQRNNDENPFDFANPSINTILGYRVGYEIAQGVSLIWDFRQFYRDDGTGDLKPIKQTTIETAFNL